MNWARIAMQFARQMECAREIGIFDAVCLGFGSTLAAIRHGGRPNESDDDDDLVFFSELITPEQEQEYLRLVQQPCDAFPASTHHKGLFEKRGLIEYRPDNHRLFWLSLKADSDGQGRKCCHWFTWEQGGYTWHCKHKKAKVKGVPAQLLRPGGPIVTYMGTRVRLPIMPAACLDWWYPGGWAVPHPGYGSSSPRALMKVPNWQDPKTWRILVR